jgi:hypothetical protein
MTMTGEMKRRHRGFHAAAHAAHRLILEQHTELRRLLALGLVQTCAPPSGRQSAPAVLPVLVGRIRSVFFAHLRDEEAALLPLFDDERLGGARRTQVLHEEHARQRCEMETLHALSETGAGDAFADRFDRLARALLVDIASEERELALALAILDGRSIHGCEGVQRPIVPRKHHVFRASKVGPTATG